MFFNIFKKRDKEHSTTKQKLVKDRYAIKQTKKKLDKGFSDLFELMDNTLAELSKDKSNSHSHK